MGGRTAGAAWLRTLARSSITRPPQHCRELSNAALCMGRHAAAVVRHGKAFRQTGFVPVRGMARYEVSSQAELPLCIRFLQN